MDSPHLQNHCSLPSMTNIVGSLGVRRTILAMADPFVCIGCCGGCVRFVPRSGNADAASLIHSGMNPITRASLIGALITLFCAFGLAACSEKAQRVVHDGDAAATAER